MLSLNPTEFFKLFLSLITVCGGSRHILVNSDKSFRILVIVALYTKQSGAQLPIVRRLLVGPHNANSRSPNIAG